MDGPSQVGTSTATVSMWPIWGIQIGAILEEVTSESYAYHAVPMDLAPPLKVTDYLG